MGQQLFPLGKLLVDSITHLRKEKFAFVLFKDPLSNDFKLIVDKVGDNPEQYCLHSFDDKNHLTLKGNIFLNEEIASVRTLKNEHPMIANSHDEDAYMSKEQYEAYVTSLIESIKQGEITKAVAARKKKVALPEDFNVGETFVELITRYGPQYCYIANTSLGLWMGASPELLLSKKENKYFTVALAGTKLAKEKRAWTEKEKDEHQIVVDYIKNTIVECGFEINETSPVIDKASKQLVHLYMLLNFYADRSIHQELHPTPAVCGLPVDKARALILKHEGSSRSLYAGYLGLEGEHAYYHVNLRCMQIFDTHADLYIGAGITAESDPTKEWLETEAKSLTMENLLNDLPYTKFLL